MNSWKTTTLGALTIVSALVNGAMTWLKTGALPDFGLIIGAIMAGIGLIAARDNNVTSEQAGVK